MLDASVIYPQVVRGVLLWVAAAGAYSPIWTERILGEVRTNLLANEQMTDLQWQRLAAALATAFPDAEIDQAEVDGRAADMPNHEKDRHVLAAAVVGGAAIVVTSNLSHFKAADVSQVGVRAVSADDFLCELLDRAPHVVRGALTRQAETMKNPRPWRASEVLGALDRSAPPTRRLVATVKDRFGLSASVPPS